MPGAPIARTGLVGSVVQVRSDQQSEEGMNELQTDIETKLTIPCMYRLAEYVPWQHPPSSSRHEMAFLRLPADFGRNVGGRITESDNRDSLPTEPFWSAINMTVEDPPLKTFHPLECRDVWFGALAGTYQKNVVDCFPWLFVFCCVCDLPSIVFHLLT